MNSISGISGSHGMGAPSVVSGASLMASPGQKTMNLFNQIDSARTGSITKSQFEQAFKTQSPPSSFRALGADSLFKQLDPNGTGSVSKQNFLKTMSQLREQFRQAASPMETIGAANQSLNSATSTS